MKNLFIMFLAFNLATPSGVLADVGLDRADPTTPTIMITITITIENPPEPRPEPRPEPGPSAGNPGFQDGREQFGLSLADGQAGGQASAPSSPPSPPPSPAPPVPPKSIEDLEREIANEERELALAKKRLEENQGEREKKLQEIKEQQQAEIAKIRKQGKSSFNGLRTARQHEMVYLIMQDRERIAKEQAQRARENLERERQELERRVAEREKALRATKRYLGKRKAERRKSALQKSGDQEGLELLTRLDNKDFLERNDALTELLERSEPKDDQGRDFREIGLAATEVAENEHIGGNSAGAEAAHGLGLTALDLVLGLTPVVGTVKDMWEVFTEKNMVTNEKLSSTERALTVVGLVSGVLTAGILSSKVLKVGYKVVGKIANKLASKSPRFLPMSKKTVAKATDMGEYIKSKEVYEFVQGMPEVRYLDNGSWAAKGDIIYGGKTTYGQGKNKVIETAIDHTVKHNRYYNGPELAGKRNHTRFDMETEEISGLISEAWIKIKETGRMGRTRKKTGNIAYRFDMGRKIGTKGETTVEIVIKKDTKNELYTAYPTLGKEFKQ